MPAYETTTTRLGVAEGESCALVQDLLPLYLDGEVSTASREHITEHLAHCERCAGFLAGAQSVRAQLRRDQIQRAASAAAATPDRLTLRSWQRLLAGGVVFMICAVGGLASLALAEGLRHSNEEPAIIGVVVGFGALMGLWLLSRAIGPLWPERGSQIAGGVGIGIGAAFLIISNVGFAQLMGVLLAMVAVVVVAWAVLNVGPAQRAPHDALR